MKRIKFDLFDVADIFKSTPYIADLKPGGNYVAKDLYEAGGVPVLLKALAEGGHLNMNCLTVTGKTLKENLENIVFLIIKRLLEILIIQLLKQEE